MSNRLTREKVLKGTSYRHTERVPEYGEEAEVVLRPLNDGEMAEVQSCVLDGLSDEAIKSLPKIEAARKRAERNKPSESESAELESAGAAAGMEIGSADMVQLLKNDKTANRLAVAHALSCDGEEWTPEDVDAMEPGVPGRLAKVAFRISGARGRADDARHFRGERGGADATEAPRPGVPAGE